MGGPGCRKIRGFGAQEAAQEPRRRASSLGGGPGAQEEAQEPRRKPRSPGGGRRAGQQVAVTVDGCMGG